MEDGKLDAKELLEAIGWNNCEHQSLIEEVISDLIQEVSEPS